MAAERTTNDAMLYSYEWDAEEGAYAVFLDFCCEGQVVTSERVGTVEPDGRVTLEAHGLRPSHPALYTPLQVVVAHSNLKVNDDGR